MKKQVNLGALIGAMKMAVRAKLKLSCFIVIGFPNERPDTLRATMKLIRRMALIGVHDVSVSKFVPYPGSELFRGLQETGKIEMDDAFFISPMDFYTTDAPSYAGAISTRRLYCHDAATGRRLWTFRPMPPGAQSDRPTETILTENRRIRTGEVRHPGDETWLRGLHLVGGVLIVHNRAELGPPCRS